jgi:hypothetical protein
MGFYLGKDDGCHEGSMFGVGGYKSNYKYLSMILDLFEEVEGTLDAHGMGVSCEDAPISTYVITCNVSTSGTRDESSSKPKAPIVVDTWKLEIVLRMTRGGAH